MSKQREKIRYLVGIDEVGRGPLAGPVTLGAFVVPLSRYSSIERELRQLGVKDSKMLRESTREYLVREIKREYISGGKDDPFIVLSSRSAREIDKRGIVSAIRSALSQIVRKIEQRTNYSREFMHFLLDGSLSLEEIVPHFETIVHGDRENILIATASVFAKVHRDRRMYFYAKKYPHYGFEKHKGYGTAFHREQIAKYGPSPIHRVSWIKKKPNS